MDFRFYYNHESFQPYSLIYEKIGQCQSGGGALFFSFQRKFFLKNKKKARFMKSKARINIYFSTLMDYNENRMIKI